MSRLLLPITACLLYAGGSRPDPATVTVMTRNMDAGTDLNYVFAATDQASFASGMAATFAEVKASRIPERAARLADEIAARKPDLIGLQEVTLWRTGPILKPPAAEVLYDQLELLMAELAKRKLRYRVAATQTNLDVEAPVPDRRVNLRITDRDVILASIDVTNVQTHRFQPTFKFGSPVMGEVVVPRGWMSVDVAAGKSKFRFVNTHVESTYPGAPQGEQAQLAQVDELLAAVGSAGMPVILAGDFNANAEPGPEHTGAVERIVAAGLADCWKSVHGDPGYTWPLFREDQASGPAKPDERIDLIFASAPLCRDRKLVTVEQVGAASPWASDHAGVVMRIRLK